MGLEIVNLQRKIKLETGEFRRFVGELSASVDEATGKTFSVAFISDRRMTELNKMFRGKDSTTDVLSFPHEPDDEFPAPAAADGSDFGPDFLGDIVISAEQASKQAIENGLSLDGEIRQLILHGVLHLCGYDHETDEGEMNDRELHLRQTLGI